MATSVTIVTVVRNDESNIEKTILSILNQNYPQLEYIIVDGGSTDRTLANIQKYSDRISLIISEPDQSIFDAMNKGVLHATGDWINFMNSGDRLADSNVISDIFTTDRSAVDVIYGNSIIELKNGKKYRLNVNNKLDFWKRYINHQSTFARTHLLKNRPFNLKYDLCSDFDFLITMFYNECSIVSLNFPVSVRCSGGKSDRNRIRTHLQKALILNSIKNKNIGKTRINIFTFDKIILEVIKSVLKTILFRSHN